MSEPQMIASDVVDAMLAELQAQRDQALHRSVQHATTIHGLKVANASLTAELQQERETIKPSLLAEIERMNAELAARTAAASSASE